MADTKLPRPANNFYVFIICLYQQLLSPHLIILVLQKRQRKESFAVFFISETKTAHSLNNIYAFSLVSIFFTNVIFKKTYGIMV